MAATHGLQTQHGAGPRRDIVVVGASAGGLRVLLELGSALPAQFFAAVAARFRGLRRSLRAGDVAVLDVKPVPADPRRDLS